MGKLVESRSTPKGARAFIEIRERDDGAFDEMTQWVRDNLTGRVWWSRTHYRDAATDRKCCWITRQKRFSGGYWTTRFWFASMKEAAIFILFYGDTRK